MVNLFPWHLRGLRPFRVARVSMVHRRYTQKAVQVQLKFLCRGFHMLLPLDVIKGACVPCFMCVCACLISATINRSQVRKPFYVRPIPHHRVVLLALCMSLLHWVVVDPRTYIRTCIHREHRQCSAYPNCSCS